MNQVELITDSALMPPSRLVEPVAWSGHIPFAMWLVEQVRPDLIVELGTHTGNSYFSFCQSVQINGLKTHCYAVDTWLGDEHVGRYDGDEVYSQVLNHNQEHYAGFSRLLRMTFDEALVQFNDGSVDFLHIDGLHTYEAVRHDFETWKEKLSERSVVIFHDINVRQADFGVWRLWEELSVQYPSVSFDHSHGLGILFVGKSQPQAVVDLLESYSSEEGCRRFRNCFERLGFGLSTLVESRQRTNHLNKNISNLNKNNSQLSKDNSQLSKDNSQLSKDNSQLSKDNSQLNKNISQLDNKVSHLENKTNHLNQNVQKLDANNKICHQKVMTLTDKICELNAVLSEMMASRSWKITKPLRAVGQQLRRLM